jgi:NAD(P)-dependent dehydrogenase (short-subunit alcohol dehydrogenase family)
MSAAPRSLEGKTAFITGASSGFGVHFARLLAGAGANVALGARRLEKLEALANEMRTAGTRAVPITLDVTSVASVQEALARAERELGGIDILVNNAGVTTSKAALENTEQDWDFVLDTNLKGAFLMATEVARSMRRAQRGGAIINVASILGLRQAGYVTPYAVSKAGLIQLTKQLALELARFRIRVNAIAPGYFETDLNRTFFASEEGKALVKRIPQRRMGQLEDLDGPLLLLASDASRYMTGEVIVIDGGHTLSSL